jgi:hypothetical protein
MRSYFRCWHLADMGNLPDVRFARHERSFKDRARQFRQLADFVEKSFFD